MKRTALFYTSIVVTSALLGSYLGTKHKKNLEKRAVEAESSVSTVLETSSVSEESSKEESPEDAITANEKIKKVIVPSETQKSQIDQSFEDLVIDLEDSASNISFYAKNLDTDVEFSYKATDDHYSASLFKLAVAVSVLKQVEQGNLTLDSVYNYVPACFSKESYAFKHYPEPEEFIIRELFERMMKDSDNSAQEMLQDVLGSNFIWDQPFPEGNMSSPEKIGRFLERVYLGDYIDLENTIYLFDVMSETKFDDRIHKGLDDSLTYSHKIGIWPEYGNQHDCGVVFGKNDFVVCLMSTDVENDAFFDIAKKVGEFMSIWNELSVSSRVAGLIAI